MSTRPNSPMRMRSDYDHRSTIGPEGYSEQTTLPPFDQLQGMEVCDSEGEKIGHVTDAYTDSAGGYARYLAVSTGWFETKEHVGPVDDVRVEGQGAGAYLVLPYGTDQLRDAPTFERKHEITREHESGIYGHYGRAGYWDAVRARQTTPAPTPEIAEAEVANAIDRGEDPNQVAVKRWGV
jgi:sporulation protein YlmC with PRC-barrel domain